MPRHEYTARPFSQASPRQHLSTTAPARLKRKGGASRASASWQRSLGCSRRLDRHQPGVARIRRRLGGATAPIRTVRGIGYLVVRRPPPPLHRQRRRRVDHKPLRRCVPRLPTIPTSTRNPTSGDAEPRRWGGRPFLRHVRPLRAPFWRGPSPRPGSPQSRGAAAELAARPVSSDDRQWLHPVLRPQVSPQA